MDSTADKKVQDYKNNTVKKAEDLIINSFPRTILKLNELLESSDFSKKKLNQIHQTLNIPQNPNEWYAKNHENNDGYGTSMNDGNGEANDLPKKRKLDGNQSGTKVYAFPYGSVPCNKRLCELIDLAKPHIQQLLEDANLLKMWISYLIPKIEDGNNFGVSVQEETLGEIQSVESEAAAFFDQIPRYFISRSKIITKVAKYPHIDDYRKAVQEIDEREYLSLWLTVNEARNRYCALHDIVIKNIDKIRTPRSTNTESLY